LIAPMPLSLSAMSHAAAFLGYSAFAIVLAVAGTRTWVKGLMILAAALTAAWAALVVFNEVGLLPIWLPNVAGTLRDSGWYAVVLAVLYFQVQSYALWRVLLVVTICGMGLDGIVKGTGLDAGRIAGVEFNSAITELAEVIFGLILVENMMRNLPQDQFWSAKHLGIGLYAILVFQVLVLVPNFLTGIPVQGLIAVRPLVFLMALPLFAVTASRSRGLYLRFHSSRRRIMFHAATLIGAGVVLQGAAIASFYLRQAGGDNGTAMSIVFGFVAAVGLAVALASTGTRSRIKAFVNENFFSYKYDYRLEWDKFIRALSAWEDGDMSLRVLRTLAELLDSHGGVLWVLRDRWHQFMPVARWSYPADLAPLASDDACLKVLEDEDCAYLDLTSSNDCTSADQWNQRFPGSWLVVPLRYCSKLIGVALLNPPRAARSLDWEDKNLISLVALQLAAYLMQEETAQALADARQLEEFNKRFAFIVHDTKNTIGQLSLLLRNIEEFGHNEEFRKDMTATLRHAVEKLQSLLGQLRGNPIGKKAGDELREEVDIGALVARFVLGKRKVGLDIIMSENDTPVLVQMANKDAFLSVLELIVGNAIEAAPKGSPPTVHVGKVDGSVYVAVSDKGPGMTQEFIAGQLFRPLKTTKQDGFGIGAYQAREIMRDLGGSMNVRSKLGEGTTVSLCLPTVAVGKEIARV
jgi:putative PEP-CTERM system histidine kinase